ncbi:arabinofuranosidase catalytic domain-containing protein [Nonomuraea rhodomycinica]|uniref:Cellulose binding domain-containing protein n=1 Tax=Nonomuraea rhodomycinica TaxID=1712872 RepID=A0A7Y6IVD1_9ACTN|nr:arabinofuranosidase catalytic domain-containing protein [Nonomuraea rhodomycinica]NUW44528.1 cellulose binding domain-containing protein [Nonomuraea rhodomycinica]
MRHVSSFPRRLRLSAAAAAALSTAGLGVAATHGASAATVGCQVTYTVTNQWPGGFGADVSVHNLGDPVNGWKLTWSFPAGQAVTTIWNGSYTQSGAQVTVTNVDYNAGIPSGGSTGFGFNGSWSGSNPAPSGFALNGVPCTGGTSSPTPTVSPTTTPTPPPSRQPCDIYAAGGTPCVAAHSTTRALYASYNGPLYQVRRASDNATRDIGVLSAGGGADAAAQDSFCAGATCLITVIYDQSGRGNHLTQAPPGGFPGPAPGGYDNLATATKAPTTVYGRKAYGVYVDPGVGYRDNTTNGVAKGDQPEGMYAVLDGTHYNGGCCFDYGNAETNSRDNGNGTMEAIYFGNIKVWGYGAGNGPWIMADLENGLFSGVNQKYNANDPTITHRYLTAVIKGEPNHWAIRGGNAQSGSLSTFYNGVRPNVPGYNPMKKEGAIILGIGGDNSHGAAGTFYEGVMTSGYPSDATENAVQANIVAAGYR